MNFEQFIEDANEFNVHKVHLAAHSFGTLIGMYLINRYSDKFHSYTGLSQIISWTENDKLCYKWAISEAEKRNDKKAIKELKDVHVHFLLLEEFLKNVAKKDKVECILQDNSSHLFHPTDTKKIEEILIKASVI